MEFKSGDDFNERERRKQMENVVSVIIPTFNTDQGDLIRCIESVINQSYHCLEILIVDDGSQIPFSKTDTIFKEERIQWISLPENKGLANARNEGLKKSKGKYLAFLDSDDWWDRNKIKTQIEKFQKSKNSKLGLVYCGIITVDESSGKMKTKLPVYRGDLYKNLLVRQVVTGSGSSVVILKDVVKTVGFFFDEYDLPQDREYWLRIAKKGWHFDYVNMPLVYISLRNNSLSSDPYKKKETFKRILYLYEEDLIEHGKFHAAWAHYYLEISRKFSNMGHKTESWKSILTAIRKHFKGPIELGYEYIFILLYRFFHNKFW